MLVRPKSFLTLLAKTFSPVRFNFFQPVPSPAFCEPVKVLTKFAAIIDLFYWPQIGFDLCGVEFAVHVCDGRTKVIHLDACPGDKATVTQLNGGQKCNWKLNAIMYRFVPAPSNKWKCRPCSHIRTASLWCAKFCDKIANSI